MQLKIPHLDSKQLYQTFERNYHSLLGARKFYRGEKISSWLTQFSGCDEKKELFEEQSKLKILDGIFLKNSKMF